jgi:branched-chain amino acid transport system ATP-binding protein
MTEHWWLFFGALLIGFILLSPEGISGIYLRLIGSPRWTLTAAAISGGDRRAHDLAH